MVNFYVNPLEGTKHSLKCAKAKIVRYSYFKIFWELATLVFGQKKIVKSKFNLLSFSEHLIYQ